MDKDHIGSIKPEFPNLICPGAQKAGTTTLFRILKQHPDISAASSKEIKFFNKYYSKGTKWYKKAADTGNSARYIMDFTPGYMVEESYVQRIKDTLGNSPHFIIILRNPVDRMYSTYNMYRQIGIDTQADAKKALLKDYQGFLTGKGKTNYYKHGLYANQVKYFFDRFPRENIKVIIFEDFIKSQKSTVSDILNFLDLDEVEGMDYDIWVNESKKFRLSGWARLARYLMNMVPKSIKKLVPAKVEKNMGEVFRKKATVKKDTIVYEKDRELCFEYMKKYIPDIKELEKIINRDLSDWINKYS